jgi:hypothetical protein
MEAPLGSRPSFVWRSIWNSRELLSQGLVWRVGNGCNIKVRGDRWLPNPHTYKVQSHPRIIDGQSMVSSLINHTSKNWNEDLLKEVFIEEEAKVIANIPLSPLLPEDRLIWRGTASGKFIVRSAYHLGKEEHERRAAQCSKWNTGQDVWKTLWALELPNPVKMFVWRACQNILPTRMNLFRRKVIEEAKCSCCEVEDETLIHALWTCPATQDVWGSKTSPFQKCYTSGVSFKEVFEDGIQLYSKEVLELLVVVARGIWFRRNKLVFEGAFSHPNDIFSTALNFIRDYKESLVKDKPLVQSEMDPSASRDVESSSGWLHKNQLGRGY